MIIKKFIAPTMPEALAKVKKELGEEAVILKTRMNRKTNSLDNGKSVEITAAVERGQKARFDTADAVAEKAEPSNRIEQTGIEKNQQQHVLPSEKLERLLDEVAQFRKVFSENAGKHLPRSFFGNFPAPMIEIGRELISRNLSEDLAFAIVSKLAGLENALSLDRAEIRNQVQQALISLIPAADPIEIKESGPTVVMFVGMSGSGKTSAIARTAMQFKVEKNIKVAIITTDNFRADSSQQIKSICRILDCPCGIVYSADELSTAVKSQNQGLILIDTPGVSPNDEKEISEILTMIRAAKAHEIHLVASAASPARDIKRITDAFGEFGIDKIVITKLDETEAPGGVVTAAIESGKRLSYVCASKEIPGQFGVATPESLAEALIAESKTDKIELEWETEAIGIWQ